MGCGGIHILTGIIQLLICFPEWFSTKEFTVFKIGGSVAVYNWRRRKTFISTTKVDYLVIPAKTVLKFIMGLLNDGILTTYISSYNFVMQLTFSVCVASSVSESTGTFRLYTRWYQGYLYKFLKNFNTLSRVAFPRKLKSFTCLFYSRKTFWRQKKN